MTLRLPLSSKKHAKIVSAFVPIMTNQDEIKDRFYDALDSVISTAPRTDKLILRGDQCESGHRPPNLGRSDWIWRCREVQQQWTPPFKEKKGKKSAEHELLITNTVFYLPTRRKTSWMHPRSKHWHLIDKIIVRRKDRQDVRVTDYV